MDLIEVDRHLEELVHGRLHWFDDWHEEEQLSTPRDANGIYTLWHDGAQPDEEALLYVGITDRNDGLRGRLNCHRRGARHQSQAAISICDFFIAPMLTAGEWRRVRTAEIDLDLRTREYISSHVAFRYSIEPELRVRRLVESEVLAGRLGARPSCNRPGAR